jgi:hypothetical protein
MKYQRPVITISYDLKRNSFRKKWPPIWMTNVDDPCTPCNNLFSYSSFTHRSSKPSIDILNKESPKMIYLEASRQSLLL